jgi:hypothetical protein
LPRTSAAHSCLHVHTRLELFSWPLVFSLKLSATLTYIFLSLPNFRSYRSSPWVCDFPFLLPCLSLYIRALDTLVFALQYFLPVMPPFLHTVVDGGRRAPTRAGRTRYSTRSRRRRNGVGMCALKGDDEDRLVRRRPIGQLKSWIKKAGGCKAEGDCKE